MTLGEAIARADELCPNAFSRSRKVEWLSQAEGLLGCEMPGLPEVRYDDRTPEDTVLLAPEPWDRLYIHWLESRMDYANGEYEKYNNSNAMYTAELRGFRNYRTRTILPGRRQIGWW